MDSIASGARAEVLDPVQNNLTVHVPGEKKREWLRSFKDPAWGVSGSWCGAMTLMKRVEGGTLLAPLMCHRWNCSQCGPQKAAWLKRQANRQVELGVLSYFWTLTVRTSEVSAAESYEYISAAWHRLHVGLSRQYGTFEFFWTREATKRGYAHLHLLTSLDIEQGELSRLWLRATGGSWVVDVQAIASDRAGDYLAKYVVEQATQRPRNADGTATRRRVYSKSRGVQFEPFIKETESEGEVVLNRSSWRETMARVEAAGNIVTSKLRGSPWVVVRDDLLGPERVVCDGVVVPESGVEVMR